MPNQLQPLFEKLIFQWLTTEAAPEAPVEGVTPGLAAKLGGEPRAITFDAFLHPEAQPGWRWLGLAFDAVFDGQFYFYAPEAWVEGERQGQQIATLAEPPMARQKIILSPKPFWREHLQGVLAAATVTGFAYYPRHRPHYHQWVFVTEADGAAPVCTGAYSAGDWVVVVQGEAAGPDALRQQLTALVNSNPWHGWIAAARAQTAS